MDMKQIALEMRTAIQFFISTLNVEEQLDMVLEIPSLYPIFSIGKKYKKDDIFSYGKNSAGDPQLYQVLQDHTSSQEWTPDAATSLYKAIGVTDSGYPLWVQPLGASDAYNTGDIVEYNGTLYRSTIDANVWSPEAYPSAWELYTE